jgi:hypothetical protein
LFIKITSGFQGVQGDLGAIPGIVQVALDLMIIYNQFRVLLIM